MNTSLPALSTPSLFLILERTNPNVENTLSMFALGFNYGTVRTEVMSVVQGSYYFELTKSYHFLRLFWLKKIRAFL